jgi:hypothetical protein
MEKPDGSFSRVNHKAGKKGLWLEKGGRVDTARIRYFTYSN